MFRNETELYLFLGIAAAVIVVVVIGNKIRLRRKLERRLQSIFGAVPQHNREDISYLLDYHRDSTATDTRNVIDAITWHDLNMDDVFQRLNICCSSTGEEYLYHLLHVLCSPEVLEKREAFVEWLANNESDRLQLQKILSGIGKVRDNGLSAYIFGAEQKKLKYARLYTVLAFLPIVFLFTAFFHLGFAVLAMTFSLGINVFIYARMRMRMEVEMVSMRYFGSLLFAAKQVNRVFGDRLLAGGISLQKAMAPFQRSQGWLSGSAQKLMAEFEVFTMIFKAIFLWDLRRFNRMVDRMKKYAVEMHSIYEVIGELEVAMCIASFRKSLPGYCLPEFTEENRVCFADMYHPLLTNPVSNSGMIDNDSIITGSNASGKSTFIKTIAVNHILAQTVHTCCASRYLMRRSYVASSMAMKDDILSGESYFITEIKSLKRIIEYASTQPGVYFIDEILRGTNTPERIAASTAVLRVLHETDSLCLIASHDIELTQILADVYDNYHFRETFDEGEITFDYKLKDGPSRTTNAIRLLEHMGFSPRIVKEAMELVQERKEQA